jgi:hypothetical protein
MAIANVVKRGGCYYVYDEKGRTTATISATGELCGFTSTTVSVRRGPLIYIYDDKGRTTGTINAK